MRGYWDRTTEIGKSVLRVREQIYKIAVELWPWVVLKRGPPSLEELGDWLENFADFSLKLLMFWLVERIALGKMPDTVRGCGQMTYSRTATFQRKPCES